MPKQLLPVGFYDLLFDEAEKNHNNVNTALDSFLKTGYRLIRTPLIEFEDNFSADEIHNTYRVTDVISGKNMVFRNDITPQITRLLDSRLSQEDLPLKLCYVGDVLHAKSDNLYADRQRTQVGAEIIGGDSEESDFEIIKSLLDALKSLNLENLLIEFSLPDFLDIFLAEFGFEKKSKLRQAVMTKNLSAIKELAGDKAEIIREITLYNNDLEGLIAKIATKLNSQKLTDELVKAQKISQFLETNFSEIAVRFDLFGDHGSSYHSAISFDVFCGNFSYPVARGGRYKIKDTQAVGATIYMSRLRKIR